MTHLDRPTVPAAASQEEQILIEVYLGQLTIGEAQRKAKMARAQYLKESKI